MNRRHVARGALVTALALAPQVLAPVASAQAITAGIEEIIVSARKLNESVLDTPASVSVIQAKDFEVLNVTSAHQLSGIVPGLVTFQGTAGTSSSYRGVGSTVADPGIESSVATFVDGVYLGHPRDYVMPVYDVQQIEFIPGTQSTLLGKNTSLGAVSISNRRPGSTFGFDASAGYTSEIDGYRFTGGVDMPLGGTFALRAAALANHEEGFIRNAYVKRDEREVTELSGRLTLAGQIGDSGSLTLVYQHDDRSTEGQYFEVLTDPNGSIAGLAGMFGQTDFDTVGNDVTYSGSDRFDPDAPGVPLPYDDQTGDRATLIAGTRWRGMDLTSQTAYVKWDSPRVTDLDFTGFLVLDLNDHEKNEVFSQELRLNSTGDGPFTYIAGVLYYHDDWTLLRTIDSPDLLGVEVDDTAVETTAWSIFASGRYEWSDKLAFSVGARYTDEEKTATYERASSGPPLADPIARTTLPAMSSGELDGNVGVEFRPTGSTMLYATWARGSKSGGYQSRPDTLATAAYTGETAYTTEIGAKFDLGARGLATLAIFSTPVDDFQDAHIEFVNGIAQTVISNTDVQSQGAQAGITWYATDDLVLTAEATYADSQYKEDLYSADGTLEAYDGMVLPRAPKWMGKVSASYETAIAANLEFRALGSANYASSYDLQLRASNPLAPRADAHTTIDLRVAIASTAAGWELALLGNNLTDERYVNWTSDYLLDGDAYYGTRSRPRTVALQFSLSR